MDKKKLLVGIGIASVAVPFFMLCPARASARQKATFKGVNYAHRGLHTRDKVIPENSLSAFALAAEKGYAVELDVQLTKDGHVVVFHDETLDRVCSVEGKICDFTYNELKKFRLCGTDQVIPLFTDVLDVINGRSAILCELKTCGKRNRELCEKTYEFISGYSGDVCIESFDPFILRWFRLHASDMLRGQLAAPRSEYEGSSAGKVGGFLLSRCLMNFIGRPQFIAYKIGPRPLAVKLACLLGAMKFGWTSHEPRNEENYDSVIFEYYKPKLKL